MKHNKRPRQAKNIVLSLFFTQKQDSLQQQVGASLVEAIIATLVLVLSMTACLQLFNSYMQNSANARIRDGISSIVASDIESLRYQANLLWKCPSGSTNSVCTNAAAQGGVVDAYIPPTANCISNSLGTAAATFNSNFTASTSMLTVDIAASASLRNPQISRSLTASGNIIKATYSSSSPISIYYVSYIVPQAMSWCAS